MNNVNMSDIAYKIHFIYKDECEKNIAAMVIFYNNGKYFFDEKHENEMTNDEVEALLLRGALVYKDDEYVNPSSFNNGNVSFGAKNAISLGNYIIQFNKDEDTLDFLYNGVIDEPILEKNYITEGLSMYIDASDVATQGSIRDITGKQSIVNHGVSTTLDNGCLNFVASESDYIDCGFVPNLTQWSTEVYFYFTNSTPADSQNIYCWGDSSSNRVRVGYSNSEACMQMLINSDRNNIGNFDSFLRLRHMVITANNGTYTVYIDGIQQYTFSGGTLNSNTSNMMIGTSSYSTGNFSDMNLKIFRHYDGKVLTPEEALQNYNYETNRYGVITLVWNDGKSLTTDGGVVVNETAMITDPIEIDNNYNYTIRYNPTTANEVRIAFYDNSQTYISRSDYLTTGEVDTVITFPENTAYFRIKAEKVGITVNEANDNIIIKKVAK